MPTSYARLLLAAALLSLAAGRADAEMIHFTYSWQVIMEAPPPVPGSVTMSINGPQDSEPISGSAPLNSPIETKLALGEIRTSGGPGDAPLTLDLIPVHLVFNLTDTSSGQSTQMVFEFLTGGTLSFNKSHMQLLYYGTGPSDETGLRILGDHLYQVRFPYVRVPVPAHGGIQEFGPSIRVGTAPEPSGLALAATAAGLACCPLLRRRRR